jgi:O-antigen ligase
MLEFRNGVLRLKAGRGIIDLINDLSLVLLLVCMTTLGRAAEGSNYLYYFSFFIFIFLTFINLLAGSINSQRILINIHTIWYTVFIVFGIASSIWAYNFEAALEPIQKMVQILAITFCLQVYVKNERDFERLLDLLVLTGVIMSSYILIETPFSQWSAGFLGSVTGYNTNSVGIFLSMVVIISAYKGLVLNKKRYLILTAAFMFMVIMTSSRKSLFISILGLISLVVLNTQKKHYILHVVLFFGLAGLLIFSIFNVPYLYNTVGFRLVSMAKFFTEDTTADNSLALRTYFINIGSQFYLEHPIIGIGLNNFASYLRQYSSVTFYAHNNYIELASGLGTIGLLIYYWFYLYLFVKLLKQMLRGEKTALLFFSFVCLVIVFDYSMVTYYSSMIQTLIVISYIAVCINDAKYKNRITD